MYSKVDDSDTQWAPVADLMAVLMLIFMFIAIVFVRTVVDEKIAYQEECEKIYRVLDAEFAVDFRKWQVDLLKDSTIRFKNPEVLFRADSHEIESDFRDILADFFPRYMESIQRFHDEIREIRIEGHTSSEYEPLGPDAAYIRNMELSQSRTMAVLRHVLQLPDVTEYAEWARLLITANGLSSSKLIYDENREEDKTLSRRVDFRLLTTSCQKAAGDENQN